MNNTNNNEVMIINVINTDKIKDMVLTIARLKRYNDWKNVVVVIRSSALTPDEWNPRNYAVEDLEGMNNYCGLKIVGHTSGLY